MRECYNYFGHRIPEINEMVIDEPVKSYLTSRLDRMFFHLGAREPERVSAMIFSYKDKPQDQYESEMYNLLKDEGLLSDIKLALKHRASVICEEISLFVENTKKIPFLEYGCGNGYLGKLVGERAGWPNSVAFADIYRNPDLSKDSHFLDLNNKPLISNLKENYGTVILASVLHHCNNPVDSLNEARKLTKREGQIIVNESVYGLKYGFKPVENESDLEFLKLELDQQWIVTAFMDHFANRILYDPVNKINLPYNFQTPDQWMSTFNDNGLRVRCMTYLGIDLPVFPVHHMQYVLEPKFFSNI